MSLAFSTVILRFLTKIYYSNNADNDITDVIDNRSIRWQAGRLGIQTL